jgi:2-polyprenyl-3-methyl-5-hydroxy-6-metoxy-1,4-benzoquinol methylase
MHQGLEDWHFECGQCLYEHSILVPSINTRASHESLDETEREHGLKALRQNNFRKLLAEIPLQPGTDKRLLDVGCAHGWFLELASGKFDSLGIEPDEFVFKTTAKRGLPVREGYFPDALKETETFDVIIFNDVFEHIPDVSRVLESCRSHLNKDGTLVLNLPNTRGIFYRISKMLHKVGVGSFFDRLWQKGLPSPHLHYFNSQNLTQLLARHGFEKVNTGQLPTLRLSGLYDRITCTGDIGRIKAGVIWMIVAASLPFLKIFPSDIIYVVSKKLD